MAHPQQRAMVCRSARSNNGSAGPHGTSNPSGPTSCYDVNANGAISGRMYVLDPGCSDPVARASRFLEDSAGHFRYRVHGHTCSQCCGRLPPHSHLRHVADRMRDRRGCRCVLYVQLEGEAASNTETAVSTCIRRMSAPWVRSPPAVHHGKTAGLLRAISGVDRRQCCPRYVSSGWSHTRNRFLPLRSPVDIVEKTSASSATYVAGEDNTAALWPLEDLLNGP